MIVHNQSNIKVHFAGAEQTNFTYVLARGANVRYFLFTVFPFIAHTLKIKHGGFWKGVPVYDEFQYLNTRHSIMDSGLFTLMFGAHAGKRSSKEIDLWYHALVDFVLKNKISSTCVEVDCQKVLGPEAAWKYREKMKLDLPNNRIINVFHKEDTKKGLDRLIEFSDYIAISVPELRALGKKKYTCDIAYYIKNKKPSIDIHLLGCTEKNILNELSFCSSADSTSWLQINRYGSLAGRKEKYVDINKTTYLHEYVNEMSIRYGISITDKQMRYLTNYIISGIYNKAIYCRYAGNQD